MPMYQMTCRCCRWKEDIFTNKTWDNVEREGIMNKTFYPEGDNWALEYYNGKTECDRCGNTDWTASITVPCKHSSWDSTGTYGVNGYFSYALGKTLSGGKAEEKKIMEERGFIAESDLPKGWWDDKTAERKEKVSQQRAYETQYQTALQNGKTKEEAVAETWNSQDIKSGKLDAVYNDKITKE